MREDLPALDSMEPASFAGSALQNRLPAFPLSFMQESLWFQEQLRPQTSTYNLPEAWRIAGPLDIKALRLAVEAIFFSHEALRTVFTSEQGKPEQIVLPAESPSLPLIDLSGTVDTEGRLWNLVETEARRPFEL